MNAVSTIDFRSPAAGFDQPLDMWHACHERVARMTNLLERLLDHLGTHPIDNDAQVTATTVRRYFDEAAPRHHDDEEVDLFPQVLHRLEAAGDTARAARIGIIIETLQNDHADMDVLWSSLRLQLARVEDGQAPSFDPAEVAQFVDRYRAHIDIEESEIGPAARAVLTPEDLQAIGRSMAERRGVDWDEIAGSGLHR
jgi:hemerythrin-like domain-containing protein